MNYDPYPEPAQLDYSDRKKVQQYMSELLSLSKLLVHGFEYEWGNLLSRLKESGYSPEEVRLMITWASEHTIYESVLPQVIKQQKR